MTARGGQAVQRRRVRRLEQLGRKVTLASFNRYRDSCTE
jgi:hypothetical protein